MIGKLVDNAVRHNALGGWIRLRSGGSDGQAFLEVVNSGPFLPDDQVPSLFEPFHSLAGERVTAWGWACPSSRRSETPTTPRSRHVADPRAASWCRSSCRAQTRRLLKRADDHTPEVRPSSPPTAGG